MKSISPDDLVYFSEVPESSGLVIDLAYAREDNFLFGERIYRQDAVLTLHRFMADIVIRAGRIARERHGLSLIIHDGLRTVDAQARMLETRAVKANPHWVENEPRLLSPPGAGGHPRGMAVDVTLADLDGEVLDMGTVFDFLAEDPSPLTNPAHREYPQSVIAAINRGFLDSIMAEAAHQAGQPLFPLPQEWWDFRLPPEIYEGYAPLSDHDLPETLRLLADTQ
ncbi:MAG: D-Ala-D-Ala dipeptidase [Alphaproteobacteria bacterium]|nr:D-Ala-D-Ala dipeptidase [Alphaproteobacteria bacterium]